jgi:hypothetical protein
VDLDRKRWYPRGLRPVRTQKLESKLVNRWHCVYTESALRCSDAVAADFTTPTTESGSVWRRPPPWTDVCLLTRPPPSFVNAQQHPPSARRSVTNRTTVESHTIEMLENNFQHHSVAPFGVSAVCRHASACCASTRARGLKRIFPITNQPPPKRLPKAERPMPPLQLEPEKSHHP